MKFQYNDGGRLEAGRKGKTGDCVCRSIAIVTGLPYEDVYKVLAEGNATQRMSTRQKKKNGKSASKGISVRRKWFKEYMTNLGFTWVPTMQIGSGCSVHLRDGDLPSGRLVVSVSKHLTAVIDGVINDTYDPSRGGNRCVYGYWIYKTTPDLKKQFINDLSNRITRKLDLYEVSILRELWKENPDHETLIQTLKSQQKDNEGVLSSVLGFDLSELLKQL